MRYSQQVEFAAQAAHFVLKFEFAQIQRQTRLPHDGQVPHCTIFRQGAVNGLHSIGNAGDRDACFCLTVEMRGVKPYSFFGTF
jgi:hypothetical protein